MAPSLTDSVRLPCGLELRNRVLKAALAESMTSTPAHLPDDRFTTAYKNWGAGGWAAVLTGNVQVDPTYLGTPNDVTLGDNLDDPHLISAWRAYAASIQSDGAAGIVQLNHPGRQSPTGAGTKSLMAKNVAPSAIPLNLGSNLVARAAGALLWGTPRAMTTDEIQHVVDRFAACARFLSEVGFKGIELHAAHGYLLAQFLSPRSNTRTDDYGGSPANRARIVVETIRAIRAVVPADFAVGIKLNSADVQVQHASGDRQGAQDNSTAEAETLEQIGLIHDAGIDFLELSGGSYEDTRMMGDVNLDASARNTRSTSARSSAREAFFLEFAQAVRAKYPETVLMLTGGFRTRRGMQAALAEGACDLVGLGRVSVVEPAWPRKFLHASAGASGQREQAEQQHEQAQLQPAGQIQQQGAVAGAEEGDVWLELVPQSWILKMIPVKSLGAGAETDYYSRQIRRMGRGLPSIPPGQKGQAGAEASKL